MKKILSIIILFALALTSVACKKYGTDTPTTTSEPEFSVTDELLSEPKITIAENGKTEFKLVNSSSLVEEIIDTVISFAGELRNNTGITFVRTSDKVTGNNDYSERYEILFGPANRAESKEVYASINYDGYAVKLVGRKIVLAAYTAEGLRLAADALFNKCIRIVPGEGGSSVYYMDDYVYNGEVPLFFTKDNPLESYKIVYSSSTIGFASRLAMLIEEKLGVALKLVKDTEPPSEFEIIAGNVARDEVKNIYAKTEIDYIVQAVGKKLVILPDTGAMNYNLIDVFAEDFLYMAPAFNFPANVEESNIKYHAENRVELTEGADLRIMSFNILNEAWATTPDMTERIPGVIGCIRAYKPDVIGIQEVSPNWYAQLYKYLGDDYVFLNTDIDGKKDYNYTALAYNKNTVKLLTEKLYFFSVGNNKRIRLINMGYFEHIATGNTFVVTNTHYNANHTTVEKEEQNRFVQASEFVSEITSYVKSYQCPVFSTGDYNCKEGSRPYEKMMESGLIVSSKYMAKEKGLKANENSIDHILYTGDATPLYFSFVLDQTVINASDHKPLFADFKFGN